MKKLTTFVLMLLFTTSIFAQDSNDNIVFENSSFKDYILENYYGEIDTNYDNEISYLEASKVTEIELWQVNAEFLQDLHFFKNLTNLTLGNYTGEVIDIQSLTSLYTLNVIMYDFGFLGVPDSLSNIIPNPELKRLNIEKNSSLKHLDLSNTTIDQLTLNQTDIDSINFTNGVKNKMISVDSYHSHICLYTDYDMHITDDMPVTQQFYPCDTDLSENIVFTDSNFKDLLLQYSVDQDGDGEISYSEATQVVNIDDLGLEIQPIQNIDELIYFTNLERFILENTPVENISNINPSLVDLELHKEISTLNLNKAQNLYSLTIKNGIDLQNIDLTDLKNMSIFECLDCVNIDGQLDFSDFNLRSFSLTNSKVNFVNLNNNKNENISTFIVTGNSELECIRVDQGNKINETDTRIFQVEGTNLNYLCGNLWTSQSEDNAIVSWKTTEETGNVSHFVISRSINQSDFEEIATIESKFVSNFISSDNTIDYSYTDTNVSSGLITYTINQVNNDSSSSEIGSITFEKSLPVTLSSFNTTTVNNDAVLSWSTSQEINNSHFNIQRSFDGQNFETIGKVDGHGNTSTEQEYSYTDYNVGQSYSIVYYRLQQVDFDGNSETFDAKAVTFENSNAFTIYPNPSVAGQIVTINSKNVESIEIYNTLGKKIHSNYNNNTIDISNYATGVYLVVINRKHTQKLIVK